MAIGVSWWWWGGRAGDSFSMRATSPGLFGVVRHAKGQCAPGYNLFDPRHDATAYLLDMDGRIIHRWSYAETQPGGPVRSSADPRWVVVGMDDHGNLLFINDGRLILKLDWDSRLIAWAQVPAHHELSIGRDGSIYALIHDRVGPQERRLLFSKVLRLSPQLVVQAEFTTASWRDRFPNRPIEAFLGGTGPRPPDSADIGALDYYHENAVRVIEPTTGPEFPPFRAGNLLLCLRNVDEVVALDGLTHEPLWSWGAGVLEQPHDPSVLANGNLLVFDNGVRRARSRCVEYDPRRHAIVWEYPTPGAPTIYSEMGGAAQRFANGNTMICESDIGRVFEVTPAGEVVWEFLHPELVQPFRWDPSWYRTRIHRMVRYEPAAIERLLSERMANPGPLPAWWKTK